MMVIQRIRIEHTDGFIRFTLRAHGHKGEPIRLPGLTVSDDIDGGNVSRSSEKEIQFVLRG